MKYKTLFRLMLKAVGVLLFVQGLASGMHSIVSLVLGLLIDPGGGLLGRGAALWAVGPLCQTIVGLYLFLRGEWVVNMVIPSNRPYCHECGYDLSGAASNRCPECDTPFRSEDVEPPRVSP